MRLSDEFIAKVDGWALQQDDRPARSEAIRRLVEELSANFGDGLAGQAAAVVG
jgi:hypothetical protein